MKKVTSLLTSLNFPFVLGTTMVGSYSSLPEQETLHSELQRIFLFSDEEGEVDYLFKHHRKRRYIDENRLRASLTKIVRDKFKDRGEVGVGKLYYKIYKNGVIETVILWGVSNQFFDYFNFLLR
ncbi:hypothetical protein HF1_11270 [Mycoplasma haemofelis str. Langford 1]|uniref:Uncharacterized protein n=1 Tax=Mycoplasma haemofelis (strain Langford 1) TaxID=941640 RepID=E8ZJ14_MYCHL|nr:hypothetical protein [Mycoplasma haemofelis]CBY93135.1 hypothetical protein HF1_11270 [Mycoplasma haemofelis str. Langford 1]